MSEYQHLLATYKMESEHPYNDGWSQLHYKEQYENLLKLGEKEFTTKLTKRKIEDLENKMSALTIELNDLKSKLLDTD